MRAYIFGSQKLERLFLRSGLVFLAGFFIYGYFNQPDENDTVSSLGGYEDVSDLIEDKASSTEKRVEELMSRMNMSEKIGQMMLEERRSLKDPMDIAIYSIGGILNGGGDNPKPNTPEGWKAMVDELQSYSQKSKLKIPLLYGVDTMHGHSNVYGATIFPHQIGLGATGDPELVRKIGKATAVEMSATDIFWGYSPSLDVVIDPRWGRFYESFGSDPENVGILGKAYIEGFQSILPDGSKSMSTAKHYIGNGSMVWGTSSQVIYSIDKGGSDISEKELREIHLAPFRKAIETDVGSIMIGLNSWKGTKVSGNRYLITEVLKEELGFTGIVVSDWHGAYEIGWNPYESIIKAVNAGIDMVMLPSDYKGFKEQMENAIERGDIDEDRIDDAVRRILAKKFELGLFDMPANRATDLKTVGSEEHREIAREAVRKSLVSLKDDMGIIPITKKAKRIIVSGSAADNLGKQAGGWTIEWQGVDGNAFPGTTILKGIRQAVSEDTVVDYDQRGDFKGSQKADIGIAIVGEDPYAEGFGDDNDLALKRSDLAAIAKTKEKCEKLIVMIISGRPLDIQRYQEDWGTIIAGWLPGSEGQGVSDVLFGDYPLTGKLPVKWDIR